MLYAFKPKSSEITDCRLEGGILYLNSEAANHRIIPLSDDIVRISYTEAGECFSDSEKPGVILNKPCGGWELCRKNDEIVFKSSALTIKINALTSSYSYYNADGELLLKEREKDSRELESFTAYKTGDAVTETVKTADGEKKVVTGSKKIESGQYFHTRLHLCWQDGEALYGLGQHEEGFMNLRGKTVYCYQANRKIAVPVLVSSKGYGLLIDTYSPLILSDNEYGSYIYTEADSEMDFYFLGGGSPDKVIARYRTLTGKAPLLPKWAFGYWQSQERYESFDEIIKTVEEFRRRDIGIDCIVQDWCSWPDGQWGQKSFNPQSYSDPDGSIEKIHSLGAKFMLSIWPNPSAGTPDYDEFDNAGLMLGTKDYYNAFDSRARQMYWNQVNKNLFCHGVDAWWCDSSEPVTPEWNLVVRHEPGRAYEEYIQTASERFDFDKLNAFPFYHALALYDGQRGCTDKKRVVNLTRCAYTGQQRLSCVLWSGDISASWDTFRRQIAAGLNFCASGLPYWTTDIGAFFVKNSVNWYWKGDYDNTVSDPDYKELYVRWYQWASYLPVFRAHGTDCRREPWAFEDKEDSSYYDALVKANHRRYELIPYIYSTAAAAYFNDGSIIRPLGFEYPDDGIAKNICDQYMFGKSMMICPITQPAGANKAAVKEVYLPAGGWYRADTREYFTGGGFISVSAALDEIPVFVREGSVIPVTDYKPHTNASDDVRFIVYAGKDGSFELYEDSGDGYGYENGEYSLTTVSWSQESGALTASDGRELSCEIISHN